jgi:hypothetical protein
MDSLKTAYRKKPNVVKRRIAGETLLIPIRGELVNMEILFALDPTAEFIWDRIEADRALDRILLDVVDAFDVERDTARSDMGAFIAELQEAGVIAPAE